MLTSAMGMDWAKESAGPGHFALNVRLVSLAACPPIPYI
jgi:hypothetical protein